MHVFVCVLCVSQDSTSHCVMKMVTTSQHSATAVSGSAGVWTDMEMKSWDPEQMVLQTVVRRRVCYLMIFQAQDEV